MFMPVVIMVKERATPRLGVRVVVEALRIRGGVLGGLEERFRIGIIVADARP